MKQFLGGVTATVIAAVLGRWLLESVPTFDRAQAALAGGVDATAEVAHVASVAALVLACLCAAIAAVYGVFSWRTARQGASGGLGVGGPVLAAASGAILAWFGLSLWSSSATEGFYVAIGGACLLTWAGLALRRRWLAAFAI
jgi:hypothetical protein